MNKDKYVFAQMTEYLDYPKFRRLVRKYRGDSYVKRFTCWNQLLTLMFGQLSGRESLRDLVTVLEAHQSKCYHLGLGDRPASRNAVSLANQTRDCRIFEEFASFMMEEAGRECAEDVFGLGGNVYAFDSTTIPLCLSLFPWARFRRHKGGVKARVLYDLETHVPSFYHPKSRYPAALRGWMFAQFVALGYRCFIMKRIRAVKAVLGKEEPGKAQDRLRLERSLLNWLKQRSLAQILDWYDCVEEATVKTEAGNRRWTTDSVARDRLFLELLGVTKIV